MSDTKKVRLQIQYYLLIEDISVCLSVTWQQFLGREPWNTPVQEYIVRGYWRYCGKCNKYTYRKLDKHGGIECIGMNEVKVKC
jgi:hypothetical protein